MKFSHLLIAAGCCALVLLGACKNEGDAVKEAAAQSLQPAAADDKAAPAFTETPTNTPPPTAEPAQNDKGVWHYTCPKGCAGGAGSAVPCAKCGTTLAHNQAYHGDPKSPGITTTPATPTQQTPEPAQNAKGVWHYTCSAGCPGGAGSATACAKCGKTLTHNSAYHQ
jgi:hypothetical protein